MPRDHGRVLCAIWRDKDFRILSVAAQRLYMLLLSQPNVNNAGVMPLQISKWAKGCDDTTTEDIYQSLGELHAEEFVVYDEDTEECLVRSFMRNDGVLKHKYIWANALRCAEQTESFLLRQVLASELRKVRRKDADELADRLIGTPPEPDPDGIPMASEWHSDDQSHSDGIPIPRGRGKGKGKGSPLVVTSVGEEPPTCTSHLDDPEKPCRKCKRRREWEEAQVADELEQRRQHRASAFQAQLDCPHCDEAGWLLDCDDMKPVEPAVKCDLHLESQHA